MVYPFVAGRNGYEVGLSAQHWHTFGQAIQRLHTIPVPPAITQQIPHETYSPHGHERVRHFLSQLEDDDFFDDVAAQLVTFLRAKQAQTLDLVERAEQCAQMLQQRGADFVVCHSDLHAGNLLIDGNDHLFIVDLGQSHPGSQRARSHVPRWRAGFPRPTARS